MKEHWLLDPAITFLNHGSFGAAPKAVLAKQSALREQLSPAYRILGKTAVFVRDALLRMKGLPAKADDLYRIYSHARAK